MLQPQFLDTEAKLWKPESLPSQASANSRTQFHIGQRSRTSPGVPGTIPGVPAEGLKLVQA
jgi:hypothetical protein